MDAASQMLKRAVEFDGKQSYCEAKVCYEEGIELLIKSIQNITDEAAKKQIRQKITSYMKRAEELKSHIKVQKKVGKFHERIEIKNNQLECSYTSLFSKYLNDLLTEVEIYDAYIRSHHQILNLVRFSELLLRKAKNLKKINITTGRDDQNSEEQNKKLIELKVSLNTYGVTMVIEYSDTLHDREIIFNNGWIIKIGRGLDYFKSPKGRMSIGFCDMDLRECHETIVDVYAS